MALADQAVFKHLLGADVELVRTVLGADLDDAIGFFGSPDDIGAFLDGVADGLFEIDVLISFQCRHGHGVVKMLG
jgi:hypothetical protein